MSQPATEAPPMTAEVAEEAPQLAPRPGFLSSLRPRGIPGPDPIRPDVTVTRDQHEHQDQDHAPEGGKAATGSSIPAFYRQRAKSYAKIAGTLLEALGGWANKAASVAGEVGEAWLPDDDDMETIPPPLGRIAARRIKIGDPGQLSDIEDMGMVAVGLIAWAAKGLSATYAARRDRRRKEAGRAVMTEAGDGQ